MELFRADLHIHTVLSPCGSLEMSPANIVMHALDKKIDIIGITDHNSTRNCKAVMEAAGNSELFVLGGAEVCTSEEIHCLTFFDTLEKLDHFESFLHFHLRKIKNNPEKFGYQVVVDVNDNILDELQWLLINSLDISLNDLISRVHDLDGIIIPAHIDRKCNSILSQLGFIPDNVIFDALEISKNYKKNGFDLSDYQIKEYRLISGSDAHYPSEIGSAASVFHIKEKSFVEIRDALKGKKNRKATISNELMN